MFSAGYNIRVAELVLMVPHLNVEPRELCSMEITMLQRLHFTLFIPSAHEFTQCFLARLGANQGPGLGDCAMLDRGARVHFETRAQVIELTEGMALEHLEFLSRDLANIAFAQSEKGTAATHVAIARWAISHHALGTAADETAELAVSLDVLQHTCGIDLESLPGVQNGGVRPLAQSIRADPRFSRLAPGASVVFAAWALVLDFCGLLNAPTIARQTELAQQLVTFIAANPRPDTTINDPAAAEAQLSGLRRGLLDEADSASSEAARPSSAVIGAPSTPDVAAVPATMNPGAPSVAAGPQTEGVGELDAARPLLPCTGTSDGCGSQTETMKSPLDVVAIARTLSTEATTPAGKGRPVLDAEPSASQSEGVIAEEGSSLQRSGPSKTRQAKHVAPSAASPADGAKRQKR
mmetsp:Transcript_42021/g.94952  ORF Transcript_42021/g.94952 Transcript_42021/m.94952 type:complete len:408 (-) Transcript_42021:188-1411(-)|eukprot:CAMPEP_0172585944 /NCGR_PEP_ID=MMETSP1068-20121228/5327_1 /TAXON_ID=35684 /ORGANISM="Pseudopedinella elastica, Strain CCMP716" /LENGTH=407 /DNA_ID=CAMNT_0013380581 /DNA_START=95 /DNA_END=1318 /DNA_ORIENTATION=-